VSIRPDMVCGRELWDELQSLDWKTDVARDILQRANIPNLRVGFNKARGVYHFAMGQMMVLHEKWDGVVTLDALHREMVPVIFDEWTDDEGKPLPVSIDAMVVRARSQWLHSPDVRSTAEIHRALEAQEERRQKKFREQIQYGGRHLMRPIWNKLKEQRQGFVGREKSGGHRKIFYDGCLF